MCPFVTGSFRFARRPPGSAASWQVPGRPSLWRPNAGARREHTARSPIRPPMRARVFSIFRLLWTMLL